MDNKMIFIQQYSGFSGMHSSAAPSEVKMELHGDVSLTEVLENFERFLKGCGYSFDGRLELIPEDEYSDDEGYDSDEYTSGDHINFVSGGSMDDQGGAAGPTFVVNSDDLDLSDIKIDLSNMNDTHSAYYWDTERNK